MARVRVAHHGIPGLTPFWSRFFTDVVRTDRSAMHQVVRDYIVPKRILDLAEEPPELRFAASATRPWSGCFDPEEEGFAILHAATRWKSKEWSLPRWRETLKQLLEFTPRVIVSCGPGKQEVASAALLSAGFGGRVVTTKGEASWAQLAWLLQRARYFVGVDTAAMHLAAAMQCPIVTLFGQTISGQYGPWKCSHVMVAPAGRKIGEPSGSTDVENQRMFAIEVEHVVTACRSAAAMRE
jgi:heptosyltransferase-3